MEKNFLKIASYNVQSFRMFPDSGKIGSQYSGNVIKEYMPDILGLNEVSSGSKFGEQPKDLAEFLDYPYYFYAPILKFYPDFTSSLCENAIDFNELKENERFYGNGLISRYPIKSAEMIPIPDPEIKDEDAYYETRCILKAQIDVCGGITVLVSHFGLADSEKINAVKKVLEILGENPEKTILMGDFNMFPDDEKLRPVFESIRDTAEGYDTKKLYSHPAIDADKKIDYIFATSDFKVENTAVSDTVGSDHKMITADLILE